MPGQVVNLYQLSKQTGEKQMNNPLETLLGKTFKKEMFSVGNQIESLLGGQVNSRSESDFEVFEIKSHRIDATSQITLGGLNTDNHDEILQNVFNKMENVIFVEYTENKENNTFTVVKIFILFSLEFKNFLNAKKYFESRKRQTSIRMHKNHFMDMYGKKIIEYSI
jgi:hypothetical protein